MVEHTMHTLWRHAHQVLYPTEGSPVAAAIMSCGWISKLFESSLWQEKPWVLCTGIRCHIWRNSVDFVDIRSRYLFWRLAFIVKSGFNYSDTTWAPWRFRTKTTPNKRPKLCISNPLWGGGGTPVISGFPSKGAINAENVSMLCGWKSLKSGTHIKYHV